MVCSGTGKMEMGTTSGGGRSLKKPLHNFNLPSFLKWGHQRQLRCKLPEKRAAPAPEEEDEGIDAVREKIMFDLKTAAERMKVAMFREGVSDEEEEEEEDDEVKPEPEPEREKVVSAAAEEGRRWNLRTRKGRNVSADPAVSAGVSASAGGYSSSSPMRGVKGERGEEKKREKFSVALSRKEIEEDFMAMVSHRPARRPKKRAKTVQRHLDTIFPGLWLSEVTPDTYKVPEVPDTGKR